MKTKATKTSIKKVEAQIAEKDKKIHLLKVVLREINKAEEAKSLRNDALILANLEKEIESLS